ncbi:MAG: acetylglutamate kinase [Proteobacteria bacterium]|nr:MAG: acetylglutamate kinase [Pseudomonadota bacterium]
MKQPIIVIKCGGSVINSISESSALCQNIKALQDGGYKVVLIHGGGPEISKLAQIYQLESQFIDGMRVTNAAMIELTQMALIGTNNTNLVNQLNQFGLSAIGLSGHDNQLLRANYLDFDKLGYVGEISAINHELINLLLTHQLIPVIAPLAIDTAGKTLNVNADMVAGALASKLAAQALILLSDIDGYYANYPDKNSIVPLLTTTAVQQLLDNKQVTSGMIPKLKSCLLAINHDAQKAYIINGTAKYNLVDLLNEPSAGGTCVIKGA